jgi:hypothetical protein
MHYCPLHPRTQALRHVASLKVALPFHPNGATQFAIARLATLTSLTCAMNSDIVRLANSRLPYPNETGQSEHLPTTRSQTASKHADFSHRSSLDCSYGEVTPELTPPSVVFLSSL